MTAILVIALLLGAGFSRAAWAEPQAKPLSWQDCVQIALKNNPDLAASKKAIDSARYQYYASWNELLPSLATLEESYAKVRSNSNQSSFLSANGVAGGGALPWATQATAKMDIFNFKDSQDIRRAKAFVSQMEASYGVSSATVLYNLRSAFVELIYAYAEAGVSESILNLRRQNMEMVRLLYDDGQESKGNLMLSEAQADQARASVDQNTRRLRSAAVQLDQILGRGDFSGVSVAGDFDLPELSTGYPDMAALVEGNPNVRLQYAIWQGGKAGVGQALSAVLPNVGVLYTRSYTGNSMFQGQDSGWSFLGSINLPLFSNGPAGEYLTTVAARKTAEQNEEQLRSVRLSVREGLENAWYNLQDDLESARVDAALLRATKQRSDESTIRYNAGLMPFETWEPAVNDWVNAEQGLVQVRYQSAQDLAAWEQAQGLTLEEMEK